MSTTPRVRSASPGEEASFRGALAHCPELATAFARLYGTVWSEGRVPQALKETARMRNARVTGCGFCRNVRFAGAREGGLSEQMVDCIVDGHETSDLPDAHKAVLAFTDAYLQLPAAIPRGVVEAMRSRFDEGEIAELGLALALFLGMSKVLISLGMEPEQMDTTVLPTPSWPRAAG